jgi:large subunit ribosomal protein L3
MGNANVCVRRLKVVQILADKRVVLIKGAVPGVEGGTVVIKASITKWN